LCRGRIFLCSLPLCAQRFRRSPDSLDDTALIGLGSNLSERFDPKLIQLEKHRGHCRVGVSEEDASTDANKLPAESPQNGLSINIVLKLLRRVPFLAIALNCKPSGLAFDNKVYPVRPNGPLRLYAITSRDQPLKRQLFENGLGLFAL
jgi:hypothetical protein